MGKRSEFFKGREGGKQRGKREGTKGEKARKQIIVHGNRKIIRGEMVNEGGQMTSNL